MKPTNEQIDKYRKIVDRVSAFKKEPTHFIEAHKVYTNTGTALSLDNLRAIIALWDENHQLECDMDADHQHIRSLETQLQELKESISKIKADAVRDSVANIGTNEPFARIVIDHVKDYADKLERGER